MRVCALGVKQADAEQLLSTYDASVLDANLAYVETRVKRGGVESPGGLLVRALQGNYAGNQAVAQVTQRTARAARDPARSSPSIRDRFLAHHGKEALQMLREQPGFALVLQQL